MVKEFNEYVRESFSEAGDIVIKPMMGGYLVYFNAQINNYEDKLNRKNAPNAK